MRINCFKISRLRLQTMGLLSLALLWAGCAAKDIQLARMALPGAADVQRYDIKQFPMGLIPNDIITVLVDTLEGEYSAQIENEVIRCLPERQDDRKTDHDNSTSANGNPIVNSATPANVNSTIPTESIFKPQAHNNTGIHSAAETGDVGKVRSLINGSKDLVNVKNKAHATPLHMAVSNGQEAVVEVLVANKADVNSKDWQGATPLKLAARNGYTDIVDLLRQYGAKD